VNVRAEDPGSSHVPGSPFLPFAGEHGEPLAIWVASAIDKIPPGSLIINPQTGKPYMNPDGSVYRWYPPTEKLGGASTASQPSPVEHGKVGHRYCVHCSCDRVRRFVRPFCTFVDQTLFHALTLLVGNKMSE